jgi:hypothetical protein
LRTAVLAIGERRRILSVQTGIAGKGEPDHRSEPPNEQPLVDVVVSALADFPEAQRALADKIAGVADRQPNPTAPPTEKHAD